MLSAAIVEDQEFDRRMLRDCLYQYSRETGIEFEIEEFHSGLDFLENCSGTPDLIFMDIVMDRMDGMSTARKLRITNEKSLLIFVTSMVQYAVQGYSVDATDFLVKPVGYPLFKLCMDRAIRKLGQNTPVMLTFSNRDGSWCLPVSEICYFESLNHKVFIHTTSRTSAIDMSLASVEKMTAALSFFRCHVSYLVNLAYVERISGYDLWVHGDRISVSRYRRKDFLDAWAAWLG